MTTDAVRANAIVSAHLADEAVGSSDLALGSVASHHLRPRSVGGAALNTGIVREAAGFGELAPGLELEAELRCSGDREMLSICADLS